MDGFIRALVSVWTDSGFASLTIENIIMILVGLVLLYLAIAKEYEPLLLLPIAFGDIMANFPNTGFETDMGVMMAIGFGRLACESTWNSRSNSIRTTASNLHLIHSGRTRADYRHRTIQNID